MSEFVFFLELIGTAAFAFYGATVAIENELDLFGIIMLGIITAVGGGVLRDIILGRFPPAIFSNPIYLVIAAAISFLVFVLVRIGQSRKNSTNKFVDNLKSSLAIQVCDAIGLAAFTVVGAGAAFAENPEHNIVLIVCTGVITGVGGGALRDILIGVKPYIFVKDVYALLSLAGALLYAITRGVVGNGTAMLLGMALIVLLRILSIKLHWNLPKARTQKGTE